MTIYYLIIISNSLLHHIFNILILHFNAYYIDDSSDNTITLNVIKINLLNILLIHLLFTLLLLILLLNTFSI